MSQQTGLGLYIHWPFCLAKCPYCDFNSHVATQIDEAAWQTAMLAELTHMAEICATSQEGIRPLSSLFFGGGTPSLMPVGVMASLIDKAQDIFGFHEDVEISAEANPTSVETKKLQDFRHAGINRVSLGVQALDDEALSFLGRGHSASEAMIALEKARKLFDRLSIDLIYGRKDQTATAWEEELSQALSFELDHLSLYQLTIEPGTQFYSRARKGEMLHLDEDKMADLYEITESHITAHDMACYEISNYAKAGAQSRHNLLYWRAQEWLGIGPGAYGRLFTEDGRQELKARRSPQGWLSQTSELGHGLEETHYETKDALIEEIMMMGLRLAEGVPLSRLQARTGLADWPFDQEVMARLIEAGWLRCDEDVLAASFEGRLRLNYILQSLLVP